MQIRQIIEMMEAFAPAALISGWDNCGLLVGELEQNVLACLLALDCREDTIKQAIQKKAGLIITHHPLIYKPLNTITTGDGIGRRVLMLAQNNIALYAAHTNLDHTEGGTNDTLVKKLNLGEAEPIFYEGLPFGRVITLNKPMPLSELAVHTAKTLGTNGVSYAGIGGQTVTRLGVCTGSAAAGKYMNEVIKAGCDAYITGDGGYHDALYAVDAGLGFINAPHFATEVIALNALAAHLTAQISKLGVDVNIFIQDNQKDVFNYIK